MSKQLVLSIKPYEFENKSGSVVSGAKVSYINKRPSSRDGETGNPPLIVNISDKNLISNFKEVPGIYDMDFEQVTGKNNKPELIISDLEFIAPVNLSVFFDN